MWFDKEEGMYRSKHSETAASELSVAIILEICGATGKSQRDLPILNDSIAVDALDNLFAPEAVMSGAGAEIEFSYVDWTITVSSMGTVSFEPCARAMA